MAKKWNDGYIEIDGAKFHYYRGGTRGKPYMVLAHGFSDTGLCWEPLAEELGADFDILMPDARGHGLSERVKVGENTDMPADLAAVMRALGTFPAVLGGHSMGGMIIGQLVLRFPELVRALVFEDPAWFLPEFSGERGGIGEGPMAEMVRRWGVESAEVLMAECRAEHPTWPETIVQRWCEGKKQLDQNFPTARDRAWSSWTKAVRAIRCPALLVTADPALGGIITPDTAQKIVEMNPLFEVAHIPGVGHHVRFGKEAEYNQAVKAFLRSLE